MPPTCPHTGEPLLNPGQTISKTALQKLKTQTNNITELMQTLNARLAGQGQPERAIHTRNIPTSRPPINLTLLTNIDDHRDTLEAWAWNIMQHIQPAYRLPRNHDWHLIEAIYQQYLPTLTTWTYAPTMVDEVTHALHHLEQAANPNPKPQTPINPTELADRYLTIENCRTALTLHWGINLPASTIRSWKHRGTITPDKHGRYLLSEILTRCNTNRDKITTGE